MGRILAIDYGHKRVGLAVSDELQIIATSLGTVDAPKCIDFLKEYCSHEVVETFVVGNPKQMNNTPSESAKYIEPFVDLLKKTFPNIKVEREDERFTSKIAFQTMIDSGMKKKLHLRFVPELSRLRLLWKTILPTAVLQYPKKTRYKHSLLAWVREEAMYLLL